MNARAYKPGEEYQWAKHDTAPFAPMTKPLNECRVSFWSQATARMKNQEPWEKEIKNEWLEDFTWREIDSNADVDDLVYVEDWNPDAELDRNMVFPLDRFRELEEESFIGEFAPVAFSSHPTFLRRVLINETAPKAAKRMKELKLDAVIFIAMCPLDTQTVCLLSRVIEENGIPTVVLAAMYDIMARAKPPRGVFANFPADHGLGRPLDTTFQLNVLRYTLNALSGIKDPGEIRDLPYSWREDFSWQEWPGIMACYFEKQKSRIKDQKIWHDDEGKAHRKNIYRWTIPGWIDNWEDS